MNNNSRNSGWGALYSITSVIITTPQLKNSFFNWRAISYKANASANIH